MASNELIQLQEQAERLSQSEQIQLIAFLAEKLQQQQGKTSKRYNWMEGRGAAPYPLMGEDAQEWVSRTRRESDDARANDMDQQS